MLNSCGNRYEKTSLPKSSGAEDLFSAYGAAPFRINQGAQSAHIDLLRQGDLLSVLNW